MSTTYDITYRYGPNSPWITRTMSYGEWLIFKSVLSGCDWTAIPRTEKRIPPVHPKRYGGQLEGNPIKSGWQDRDNGNCRQLEKVADSPPMRRTDIVAQQSGGLSPAQLMKHAKR